MPSLNRRLLDLRSARHGRLWLGQKEKPRRRSPATERHTSRNPFPSYRVGKNGNCSLHSPNWSSSVTCDCDTNTAAGGFPVMIRTLNPRATPMIGMRRNVNVTACAWDCAAQYLITGSLDSDWRPARALARRMSQWAVMPATATARLTRATMALPWDRLISVIRVSLALP